MNFVKIYRGNGKKGNIAKRIKERKRKEGSRLRQLFSTEVIKHSVNALLH